MFSGSAELFPGELSKSASLEAVKPRIKLLAVECPSYVRVIGLVATGVIGGGGATICVATAVTSFGVPLIATSIGVPLIAIWGTISGGGFISFVVFLCFRKVEPQARVPRKTIVQDEPKKKDPVVAKKKLAPKKTEEKPASSASRKKKSTAKNRRLDKDKRKEQLERLKREREERAAEAAKKKKDKVIVKPPPAKDQKVGGKKGQPPGVSATKRGSAVKKRLPPKKIKRVPKVPKKPALPAVTVLLNKWCLDVGRGREFELEYTPATKMLPSLPQIGKYGGSYSTASHPMVLQLTPQSLNSFPGAEELLKGPLTDLRLTEVYLIVYDASQLKGSCVNYAIHPWLFTGLTPNTVEEMEAVQAVEAVKKKKELAHSEVGVRDIVEIGLYGADGITGVGGRCGLAVGKLKKQSVQVHSSKGGMAMSPDNAKFTINRRKTVSSFYSVASANIDPKNPENGKRIVATFSVVVNSTTEAGDGRTLMEALRDGTDLGDILDKLNGHIAKPLYNKIEGMIHPPQDPNEG